MLSIAMIVINVIVGLLGVYLFDYKIDGVINSPLVIVLSLLVGAIAAVLFLWIFIEVFYVLMAEKYPKNSMKKHLVAKHAMKVPLFFTNRKVTVEGLENLPKNPHFSIYSNHTSLMDIPVLMTSLSDYPVAFLAKIASMRMFSIGKWAQTIGCVGLERKNNRKGVKSISHVVENIKGGSPMVIFPEGTRNLEVGTLLKFRNGAFKAALNSETPLVPITIIKAKNFRKIKWPFRKNVTVFIHKPLEYSEFKDLNTAELSNKVRDIIQSKL